MLVKCGHTLQFRKQSRFRHGGLILSCISPRKVTLTPHPFPLYIGYNAAVQNLEGIWAVHYAGEEVGVWKLSLVLFLGVNFST